LCSIPIASYCSITRLELENLSSSKIDLLFNALGIINEKVEEKSMSASITMSINSNPKAIHSWWKRLAYRHKSTEFLMYFMFVSGVLLWDFLALNWQAQRWLLLSHLVIGATFFTVIVGAFWSSHRRLLQTSKKPFMRQTGILIEWLLSACTLTGFYMFFYGNTGDFISTIIQDVHFYSSWILAPLVCRHAVRWSIINVKRIFENTLLKR